MMTGGKEVLKISRRTFIKWSLLGSMGLSLAGCRRVLPWEKDPSEEAEEEDKEKEKEIEKEKENSTREDEEAEKGEDDLLTHYPVPRRYLGRTGLTVSILGLGGAITVARQDRREEAEKIVEKALDLGVNYIDTAPTYGHSESNIGSILAERRREVCLASKTEKRTYDGAMKEFEQSANRLGTDYLDLLQLHGVHSEEDWDKLKDSQGALKALEELKYYGHIGHVGITGHKNAPLIKRALQEYSFDSVLLTVNCGDVHQDSFIKEVLPVAKQKDMGIVGMKVASYGRIFREEGVSQMEPALQYALTQPVSTVVVGVESMEQLAENVKIAQEFAPLSEAQMQELEDLTYPYQDEVNFFKHQW